jgi:creatinine amidohydrolase/Fe(II)-dependent formamide hydrolase-like protein
VLEYHAEHLPVGVGMLAVTRALERLEPAHAVGTRPPVTCGAASHAPAGRQAIRAALEAERGEGWWDAEAMRHCYGGGRADPFR